MIVILLEEILPVVLIEFQIVLLIVVDFVVVMIALLVVVFLNHVLRNNLHLALNLFLAIDLIVAWLRFQMLDALKAAAAELVNHVPIHAAEILLQHVKALGQNHRLKNVVMINY